MQKKQIEKKKQNKKQWACKKTIYNGTKKINWKKNSKKRPKQTNKKWIKERKLKQNT